jgi:hypothetical protein
MNSAALRTISKKRQYGLGGEVHQEKVAMKGCLAGQIDAR